MERLDVFMARANAEYYATRDPFADFTTSPEISQVFGEILGLWAAVTWEAMGRPDKVILAEAGPGRGTLMRDALRAARQAAPAFAAAASVHFIESSLRLRERQGDAVPDAVWHDSIEAVPNVPMILLANEFLDALPIRQFVRTAGGWAERYVKDGAFVLMPVEARPLPNLGLLRSPSPSGEGVLPPLPLGEGWGEGLFELNEPAKTFTQTLASRLAREGGAALILDYGPEHATPGESLQAIRDGRPADPLADPGSADLTAHVDFRALADIARQQGAAVHGPVPQGKFLAHLGLFQRTDRLACGQPPARAAALIEAAQRLAEPSAMGRLFKAMAITHPALSVPEGFAA